MGPEWSDQLKEILSATELLQGAFREGSVQAGFEPVKKFGMKVDQGIAGETGVWILALQEFEPEGNDIL